MRQKKSVQIVEHNFRNSLDNSPLGIRIVNGKGELLYVNKAILDIFGFRDVDELKATPKKQLYTAASYAEHLKRKESRKQGKPVPSNYEICIVRQDGEIRHLAVFRKEVIWDGKTQYQVLYQDITERKNAEEALRTANRALRMILECNKALVNASDESELLKTICELIVNVGGYRMAWAGYVERNKARTVHPVAFAGHEDGYLDAINVTWDDSEYGRVPVGTAIRTGKHCLTAVIPTDPIFKPWRAEAMKRGYSSSLALPLVFRHTFGVLEVYKAEPDTFYTEEVELLAQLALDLSYVIASMRTKLEHKKMRAKMVEYKELNKVKNSLLSTVSHELRTPLATIKGYCTMLIDYDRRIRHKEKWRCLRSIDKATDRLTELVEHLLDMSRLDAGLLKLQKKTIDIKKLVQEVVNETRIRDSNHKIIGAVEMDLPTVIGDPKRIRQILDNLIDNSIKYSEKGTSIIVRAHTTGEELLISVADEGTGIPEEDRERVFTRMYRAEQRLDGKGGLGLGLSLCKGLVEAHEGHIWMESNNGKGNICVFTLPLS